MDVSFATGNVLHLYRYARRVEDDDGIRTVLSVAQEDGSIPLDVSAYEWMEGATLPTGYAPADIQAMGRERYLSLLSTLPTPEEQLRADIDYLAALQGVDL